MGATGLAQVKRWHGAEALVGDALCLVDEFSPAEAAGLLGKSGAALRQALHAGREALIRHLADGPTTEPTPEADPSTSSAPMAGRKEVR